MPRTDSTQKYIRETCADLDAQYDREALRLICGVGVFAVEDPSEFDQAVERLRGGTDAESAALVAAEEAAATGATPEARRAARSKLEGLQMERLTESIEAAYLLGIAVGRRLGPGALVLRSKGGKR